MTDIATAFLPSGIWDGTAVWDDNLYWSDRTVSNALLPSSATSQELALEQTVARADFIKPSVREIWLSEACPPELLPWLAWGLSVDEWDPALTVDQRRKVIASSVSQHRHKGTVAAVRQAVQDAGLGGATLVERYGWLTETPDHWAEYRVLLAKPMSIAQAAQARRIITAVAPARCHLKSLDFTEASNFYNGALTHDGTYSHGEA